MSASSSSPTVSSSWPTELLVTRDFSGPRPPGLRDPFASLDCWEPRRGRFLAPIAPPGSSYNLGKRYSSWQGAPDEPSGRPPDTQLSMSPSLPAASATSSRMSAPCRLAADK
eukprot:scaffold3043_cov360-Prasinococcus_capsulatus_cf.AAC.5